MKQLKKTKNLIFFAAILILGFAGTSGAGTVQLDLSTLGMPTEYNFDSPFWQTNFDLGVTFTEISHVYINWSGEIVAGLAVDPEHPQPYPLDVGAYASLGFNPHLRITGIYGGQDNYPSPEPFSSQNEFIIGGATTWSDLLNGEGTITLEYTEIIILDGKYVQHGSITLDSAILVVDGTVVPEPVSILLLALGALGPGLMRHKPRNADTVR